MNKSIKTVFERILKEIESGNEYKPLFTLIIQDGSGPSQALGTYETPSTVRSSVKSSLTATILCI